MKKFPAFAFLSMISFILSCGGVPENKAFEKALEKNGYVPQEEVKKESGEFKARNAKVVESEARNEEVVQPEARNAEVVEPAKWVNVSDMAENSFSLLMPKGWTNAAFLHRMQETPKSLVTAVAPDKNTVIYFGDPRLPMYTLPNSELEISYRQMGIKYPYQTGNFVDAETYFNKYLQKHFGGLNGFRVIEKFENIPLLEIQEKQKKRLNLTMEVNVSTVSYRFEYQSNGRLVKGELDGATIAMGNMWLPEVGGFCTTGNPEEVAKMMLKMADSRVNNPAWQEAQNENHRQAMAQIKQNEQRNMDMMTQQHNQRMGDIQRSGAAHQQRMANLQQANDIRNEQWEKNQASQDIQHEKFLNVIKGEHTVKDSEGNTYQVDNNQDKYFVNKHNNTYIGTDATKTLDDLRQIKHLNIDNFEEVQIIR